MAKARKKRKAFTKPAAQPGYQRQPEDLMEGKTAVVLRLPRQPPKQVGPKVVGKRRLSRKEVWEKVESAMRTLRALPDRERRFFVVKSGWPDFAREYMDAYGSVEAIAPRYQPTPQEVSEYLDILAWTRHLERREWQLLWWRSFGTSFGVIGKYIGRSDEAARKRFENALTDVWTAANGI